MRLGPLPTLRLRPTSPPNSFFQLQGTRHRMRCVWAPQVPSRKPTPQSLLLGVQGPQIHSAHSLPGPPFFTLSTTHGEQSSGPRPGETHSETPSWSPGLGTEAAGLTCPAPALLKPPTLHITFLFGHRRGERQQGEEGEEEEASALHPGGRARVRVLTGGRRREPPTPFPQFPGPKGRAATAVAADLGGWPLPASRGAQREESPQGPSGARDSAQTPTPPPAPRSAAAEGPKPPRALRGPARSLARCPRCFAPSRAGPVPLRPPRPLLSPEPV